MTKLTLFFLLVIFLFAFTGLVPWGKHKEVIYRENISENRPFAGILKLNGKNRYVGTEVCTIFWLSDVIELDVTVWQFGWYETMVPTQD